MTTASLGCVAVELQGRAGIPGVPALPTSTPTWPEGDLACVAATMMNLAHATAAHRGIGMSGPNHLGMSSPPTGYTSAPGLHQRSPFAIQELLGLNQQDNGLPRPPHHTDTVISASAYIPRSLGPTTQAACLGDPTAVHHSFTSWRPNFMPFSTSHTHHQNMLNLGGQPHMSQLHHHTTDNSTGESTQPTACSVLPHCNQPHHPTYTPPHK